MKKYSVNNARFVGRWQIGASDALTVTPGAFFELAFRGEQVLLHFDVKESSHPYPHLWIQLDDGPMQEVPLASHIRAFAPEGEHLMRVIYKGCASCNQRWYPPLDAKVRFLGFDAPFCGKMPAKKKAIAFVGDSITEGVFVDVDTVPGWDIGGNLVYQNDAASTYAWHTARLLDCDPIIQGFGSTGVTRGGLGGVPNGAETYAFNYYNCPISYDEPAMVVINHGVNDDEEPSDQFVSCYQKLLDTVRRLHPNATVVLLQPFAGLWEEELQTLAKENRAHYISTKGWYDNSLLHPLRPGHLEIANRLAPLLKELL